MPRGRVHVGTSGFVYDHWNGTFYPTGLSAKERFAYYAERFGGLRLRVQDEPVRHAPNTHAPRLPGHAGPTRHDEGELGIGRLASMERPRLRRRIIGTTV